MKLNTKERDVFVGGVSEQKSFTIEMNAMAFHSVIDGIYADKISSPFRELCTNAYDGHRAAQNQDEPFDVFLPSMLNPTFKVRDYGIGLSHEDIMGLYSTMFASSKRDSNEAVGMIGLGSKSPFAYTSAFTVTSFYEGKMRVYSAFIGETGVPQIALMHEEDSNARGGIEVQFPVKQEDVKKFRDAAPRVLFGFSPYPNVVNETYVKPVASILYTGEGWTMYSDSTVPFTGLMARQGCVLYPIDPKPVGVVVPPATYGRNKTTIYQWPVVIDFPIGSLDVATSREALGYTAKTIESIKNRIEEVKQDMTKLIDTEIRSASTFLEASIIASKARYDNSNTAKRDLFGMLFSTLRYGGRALIERVSVKQNNPTVPFTHYDPRYAPITFWGAYHPLLSFRPKAVQSLAENISFFEKTKIFVELPGLKNGPSRMRRVIRDLPSSHKDHVLWLRPVDQAALETMIASWGNPPYTDLATIEPIINPKKDIKAPDEHVIRLRYHDATTSYSYNMANYEFVKPTPDLYYIKQESANFYLGAPNDPPMTITGVLEWLRSATTAGLIPLNQRIYYLNTSNIKVLERVAMKPIGHLILESAKKLKFTDLINQGDAAERNRRTKIAEDLLKSGLPMPDDLAIYVKQAARVAPTGPGDNRVHSVLKQFCPTELEAALKQTDTLRQTWIDIKTKYPLLTDTLSDQVKLSHYLELIKK